MGKKGGGNTKADLGNEKKAANAKVKALKEAAQKEAEDQKEWEQGANVRGAKRATADAEKELERMAKAAEKRRLMEEEEAQALAEVSGPKKSAGKKKGDIAPWEAALEGAKKPSTKKPWVEEEKAKKKAEQEVRLEAKRKEEASLAKAMSGMDTTDFMSMENRNRGKLVEGEDGSVTVAEDDWASGLDAALDSLVLEHRARTGAAPAAAAGGGAGAGGGAKSAAEGGKNLKALYRAYEDKKLIILRAEHPGLRLRQYQERVFEMWKKAPENPLNIVRVTAAPAEPAP